MIINMKFLFGLSSALAVTVGVAADNLPSSTVSKPLVIGPVALTATAYASAATITGNALGSGVNGPQSAQTGLTVNLTKDNWWTGGKVGEIDGINVMVRQNAPGSDAGGMLINVQNQGNGFLAATEFASTIVDPVSNTITHGIDVQEGVLNKKTKDFIGAVYTADNGALGTGVLVQNSPGASWAYALQYQKNGAVTFSVDGNGGITATSAHIAGGIYTSGSYHLNLATPAKSSSPCSTGQIGADRDYIYICVATNTWRRSALSSF